MDVSPITLNLFETLSSNFLTKIVAENIGYPLLAIILLYIVAKGFKTAFTIDSDRFESGLKNSLLFLINGFTNTLLLYKFTEWIQHGISAALPELTVGFWANIPLPIVFLCAFVATDFAGFFSHRVLHMRLFWGTHVIHHSDRHMNWTTTFRIHLFEGIIMMVCVALTLGLLGFPPAIAGAVGAVMSAHNKYVHCQLGWTHGLLRKWIVSPNNHRWHHADTPNAYNKNFGQFFCIWDRMFGSYYDPGICDVSIGLKDGPEGLGDMLIYPFRYWRQEYGPKARPKITTPLA